MALRILVYGPTTSRVGKILWTLGEVGSPFERDERSIAALKQDPAYLRLNPKGTVPTLLVEPAGGSGADAQPPFVVNESNSCVAYLASKLSPGRLYPATPEAVANAWQWLEWGESSVAASMSLIWFGLVKKGGYPPGAPLTVERGESGGCASRVNGKSVSAMLRVWNALETQLSDGDRPFIQGEQLTMADITAGVHANRLFNIPADEIGVDTRETLPRTYRYWQRLCEREPYREHIVPFGKP
jgi:glutathione S-transferase